MRFFKDNGLTIVLAAATLATVVGMIFTGHSVYNDELVDHVSDTAKPLIRNLGNWPSASCCLSEKERNYFIISRKAA